MGFQHVIVYGLVFWLIAGMILTNIRRDLIYRHTKHIDIYNREIIKSVLFSFFYRLPKRVFNRKDKR